MIGQWLKRRVFNGRPATTILQLAVASIFVGAVLHWGGISPLSVWRWIGQGARDAVAFVVERGASLFGEIGMYLALGAAIVVPVWLIARLIVRPARPAPEKPADRKARD